MPTRVLSGPKYGGGGGGGVTDSGGTSSLPVVAYQ